MEKSATADEVRKYHRRLAHQASSRPQPRRLLVRRKIYSKVQEAYDVLSDPKKKEIYDQVGSYSENGMPGAGGAGVRTWASAVSDFFRLCPQLRRRPQRQSGSFQDIFSQWFGRSR